MLTKFEKHIASHFSFLTEKKLLVAISGGIDSVVLTHLLHQLKLNISLAHCNFKLREKESDLDEVFVTELAKKLNLKVYTTQFDTQKHSENHKTSTQISARELRYNWFDELVEKHHFNYIITAHHADDNLETFIINLTRGTGLKGLTGIPEINKNIVRPLLIFSREEIENYAVKNNIRWREDQSNSEIKYIRNRIRHKIVPELKAINPELLHSFSKTVTYLKESEQIIKDQINTVSKNSISKENKVVKFDIEKLQQLSNPKIYLYELLKEYGFSEWNDVYNLLSAQSGKFIIANNYRLLKDRDFLLLSKINNNIATFSVSEKGISSPIKISIEPTEESTNSKNEILVDKSLLNFPLTLRKWQEGDIFFPLGMKGKKKVSKYFKDEKLSLIDKENTWLLCSDQNEIIWIVGKRQDRRFTVSENTKNSIKIRVF